MAQEKVKIPREHPILNNLFTLAVCCLLIAPILVMGISAYVKKQNQINDKKTSVLTATVIAKDLITDSKGDTLRFNTQLVYDLDGKSYKKTYETTYFIGEPGDKIRMYYEEGNPYSAVAKKDNYEMSDASKKYIYTGIVAMFIILFAFNIKKDIARSKSRRMAFTQQQLEIQRLRELNGGSQGR